jgi:hypothetical protein
MGTKSDLEKIIRKLVEDIREEIIRVEKDKSALKRRG